MDRELQTALDEVRALPLALIEVLSEKFQAGSFQKVLAKDDAEKVFARASKMVERFRQEREEAARGLILPPGTKP